MGTIVRGALVVGTFALLTACGDPKTSVAPRQPGTLALDVVSGDRQTSTVGTAVAPLVVKVTDNGNPVAGQVLNFRVTAGNGSVYGGTEITGDKGLAQEVWTLGTKAGERQSVEVRAVSPDSGSKLVFATFTA